jgi:hypothetical protein
MIEAPRIWTRRAKIIEPRDGMLLRPRLAGYWKLEAIRPDGRRRVVADWFPNLITDVGLDVPGTSASWVESCVVGTGNATPSVSDTVLAAQVASSGNRTNLVGGSNQTADRYTYARATYRFAAGAAAGNLAEIGIKTGAILLSRALILDGGGSPTTITILADEVLDCTYEIRNYPPLTDVVTTMVVGSTTHDITLRAAEVDSVWDMIGGGLGVPIGWAAGACTMGAYVYGSTSVLGAVTAGPTTAGSFTLSRSNSSYTPGTHTRDFSYTWDLTAGNVSGGVAAVLVCCGDQGGGPEAVGAMAFQFSVSPVIPKNNTNNLVLNFRQSWARRTI